MPVGLRDAEIGGGIVRRLFTRDGQALKAGTRLTREEILAMSINNRRALIRNGALDIYPPLPAAAPSAGQRFALHIGGGRYEVISGSKLTAEPVTKDEAQAILDAGVN
jgi:hypothetical protein